MGNGVDIIEKIFEVSSERNQEIREQFLKEIRLLNIKESEEIELTDVHKIVLSISNSTLEMAYMYYIVGLSSKFETWDDAWSSYDNVKFIM